MKFKLSKDKINMGKQECLIFVTDSATVLVDIASVKRMKNMIFESLLR